MILTKIIMKKLSIIAAAALLLCSGHFVSAQSYIPDNEITVNVFGGANLGMVNLSSGTELYEVQSGFKQGINNPAFGVGIGYIHHFNDNWGFLTGVDAAIYNFKVQGTSPDHLDIDFSGHYDKAGDTKTMYLYYHSNFSEKARLISVQVPLMLQYITPLSEGIHFYAAGGATVALNLSAKYKQSYTSVEKSGLIIDDPQGMTSGPGRWHNIGFPPSEGDIEKNILDIKASFETGLRWALSPAVGIYTGVFVDYGLLPAFVDSGNPLLKDNNDFNHGNNNAGTFPATQVANNYESSSIFNSRTMHNWDFIPDPVAGGFTNVARIDDKPGDLYVDPVHAGIVGLKVRFTFGKSKIHKAPEETPYVPAVVPVQEPVKEEPKPVEEEVPEEIQQVMIDLSNTLFAFNKFDLNAKARGYLDTVVAWLKQHEDLKIEIAGHTDNIGTDEYNQKLSESRAKSVYDYFVKNGVKAENLSYSGYGESQPIATNDTDEGRQQNRRVELKIVK